MPEEIKKKIIWKPYIIAGIISLIFGIGIFCLFFFAFGKSIMDGFAFGAVILISFSVLIWISNEGFFDLAAYGFKQFGNMLFSKKPNVYNDYAGYKSYKREIRENKPKYFLSVLIVGLLFLLSAILTLIIK